MCLREPRVEMQRGLLFVLIMLLLATTTLVPSVTMAKPRHEHRDPTSYAGDVDGAVVGGTVVPQGRYTFMTAIEVDFM